MADVQPGQTPADRCHRVTQAIVHYGERGLLIGLAVWMVAVFAGWKP